MQALGIMDGGFPVHPEGTHTIRNYQWYTGELGQQFNLCASAAQELICHPCAGVLSGLKKNHDFKQDQIYDPGLSVKTQKLLLLTGYYVQQRPDTAVPPTHTHCLAIPTVPINALVSINPLTYFLTYPSNFCSVQMQGLSLSLF